MRNHADAASRKQEFYRFADLLPAIRNMLGLRYALLPYLSSEFMKRPRWRMRPTSGLWPLTILPTPTPGRWRISCFWARA